MATSTVTHYSATGQDGHFIAAGWQSAQDDGIDNLILEVGGLAPSTIGLIYDWGLVYDEASRPIDPPVLSGQPVLTLTSHPTVLADPGADTVELWGVPEVDPSDYSTVLFPFNRSEVLLGAGSYSWTGAGTQLEITVGQYLTSGNASTPTCYANWQNFRGRWLATSRWTGRLALSLKNLTGGLTLTFESTALSGSLGPSLDVEQTDFHTGFLGFPFDGRARRCPRSGLPLMTDHAVEDGYRPGLWVRPQSFDPKDPEEDRKFYPPPNESQSDDEVL